MRFARPPVLLLGLWFALSVTYLSAQTVEWEPIGRTSDDYISFQAKSVRRLEGATIKAWVKYLYRRTPAEQANEYIAAHGNIYGYDAVKYGYTLELMGFKCSERKISTISHFRYSPEGKYLGGYQNKELHWADVVPGSIGETTLDAVCDFYLAPLDKFFEDIPPARPKQKKSRPTRRRTP